MVARKRSAHRRLHSRRHRQKSRLCPDIYRSLVHWAQEYPQIDVFSSPETRHVRRFWHRHQDRPWAESWGDKFLFVHNLPHSRFKDVVAKMVCDGARRIALLPVDKGQSWFWAFGEIVVDWVDFPQASQIFQDAEGNSVPAPSLFGMPAVLFDAHDAPSYGVGGDVWWDDQEVPEVQVTQGKDEVQWRKQTEPTVTCSPEVPGFGRHIRDRSVRAVLDSDMEHPMCEIDRRKLETEFEEVFQFKPHTELNEFPGLLGEQGTCKIELKENLQPKAVQPYRCVGIRAALFKALIENFQGRGMLRQAKGDPQWVSRAFVVPKPGGNW